MEGQVKFIAYFTSVTADHHDRHFEIILRISHSARDFRKHFKAMLAVFSQPLISGLLSAKKPLATYGETRYLQM